jgi:hypothetical protein
MTGSATQLGNKQLPHLRFAQGMVASEARHNCLGLNLWGKTQPKQQLQPEAKNHGSRCRGNQHEYRIQIP